MSHAAKQMDVFLQPGEHFVGDAGCRIRTLLGSCVSITLWHPQRHVGGMSHYLLATRGSRRAGEFDGRYGDEALHLLLRDLQRAGVEARQCQAKVFGGGNMFPSISKAAAVRIGTVNGEAAHQMLDACGIPVVSQCLYGVGHRQVIFDVATGHVWSRQLKPMAAGAADLGKAA
jgi:chemotaxis protein CheD